MGTLERFKVTVQGRALRRSRWGSDNALLPSDVLRPALGVVAVFVAWDLAIRVLRPPSYLVIGPLPMFVELANKWHYFVFHSAVTLYETLLGFAAGVSLGVAGGILLHYLPLVRATLYPCLIALNTIPKVALAPLLIVWFGFGTTSKVIVALLIAFFPLLVSTVDGLNSVPVELTELARLYRASTLKKFLKIDLMSALPSIFTGLKVSISMAVGGAVVGEFIAGRQGLGYIVVVSTNMVNLRAMFAALLLLAVMAVLLFLFMEGAERVFIPWARHLNQR